VRFTACGALVMSQPTEGEIMQPLRLRIDRIVDCGTIVSLIGTDTENNRPVTVHIDHRPFAAFWQAWHDAGSPQPIEYQAGRLMLHLDLLPIEGGGEVLMIERDKPTVVTANDDRELPLREVEP
jgi:hypothetical protein